MDKLRDLRNHKLEGDDLRMLGMEALNQARSLVRQRQGRAALFPAKLFGEPAWDMLLTLYIARCEGRCLSFPALSLSLNLPVGDALRWVRRLEASDLVQRGARGETTRSRSVSITDAAFETVTTMLLQGSVGAWN
jgi:DNA-binding MarR family transcriptional regulator